MRRVVTTDTTTTHACPLQSRALPKSLGTGSEKSLKSDPEVESGSLPLGLALPIAALTTSPRDFTLAAKDPLW